MLTSIPQIDLSGIIHRAATRIPARGASSDCSIQYRGIRRISEPTYKIVSDCKGVRDGEPLFFASPPPPVRWPRASPPPAPGAEGDARRWRGKRLPGRGEERRRATKHELTSVGDADVTRNCRLSL